MKIDLKAIITFKFNYVVYFAKKLKEILDENVEVLERNLGKEGLQYRTLNLDIANVIKTDLKKDSIISHCILTPVSIQL